MSKTMSIDLSEVHRHRNQLRLLWLFAATTLVSSLTFLLVPPGLTGPVIVVFIPTSVAVALIRIKAGRGQVSRLLFTLRAWRVSLIWVLISLADQPVGGCAPDEPC